MPVPYTGTDHAQVPNSRCGLSLVQALNANCGTHSAKELLRYIYIHELHDVPKFCGYGPTCHAGEEIGVDSNRFGEQELWSMALDPEGH